MAKTASRLVARAASLGIALLALTAWSQAAAAEMPGLLFYLSADRNLTADYAAGEAVPNFADKVEIVGDGHRAGALSAQDDVVLSWQAPGNISAQRGTLSFFWRARYPLGEAPFPIFRVAFADHTSWDMAWLRIDYNGHGFDAFVTDANLARTRVSFTLPTLPDKAAWTHLAFSWDETTGVRLYVNGKLAAGKDRVAVYDVGLNQFGPTSRVVSPHQVQSRYNFMRGGDLDELKIYDRALAEGDIASLASDVTPVLPATTPRDLNVAATAAEWALRYGWNRKGDLPAPLASPVTRVRKVEFTDARDLKEWMWKATDGIAETTWPGVYNRSRLPGRNDGLNLPDWNVYVEGGKALDLTLPDEAWNHLEFQGAAFGTLSFVAAGQDGRVILARRAAGQERTPYQFASTLTGGKLTFTNVQQETPIQEIAAYNITPGTEPEGSTKLSYTVRASATPDSPDLDGLNAFIRGRYPADEQASVVALPEGAPVTKRPVDPARHLPLVHILIPYEFGASPPARPLYRSWGYGWENMHDALDGIAIDLPALNLKTAPGEVIPLNIQVKDPIWPERNLMDVSVSVRPGEPRTLWLDTRDRLLPNQSLYLTIASAAPDFDAKALDGARIRLVFKPREAGLAEHITDRLNQAKDNWGFLVEEHTASKRERLYQRVVADMTDLFRADPDNRIGREYWADITYNSQGPLPFTQALPPGGEPLWAFRQLEDLKRVRHFVNWWIDSRQVSYGDFGGGISDDTDLAQQWPGLALMGVDPDKITASQMRLADAAYRNGMFTNGLSTLQTDELHAYEEGINSNSESLYLNWGNPKVVERLMTTTRAYDRIIEVNAKGHMHFVSNWYSGKKVYREGPWEWGKYYSYLVLHPGMLLGQYNSDPTGRKYVTGLADGLLAHGKVAADGTRSWPDEINWRTDDERGSLPVSTPPMQLFWAAWRWTGKADYLGPILAAQARVGNRAIGDLNENVLDALDRRATWGAEAVKRAQDPKATGLDRYLAWQVSGDKRYLEDLYGEEIRVADQKMYSQTEGHWWSDRVEISSDFLQRSRLGGIALKRNQLWPGTSVSWRFDGEDDAVRLAILVPGATPDHIRVIAYNTAAAPISGLMTGWNVTAGQWRLSSGIDTNGDDVADGRPEVREVTLEPSLGVRVEFAPGKVSVLDLTLVKASDPVNRRADLGIGPDDVTVTRSGLEVRVHSLGAANAAAGLLTLSDRTGHVMAQAAVPALKAPRDLVPKTAMVRMKLAHGVKTTGLRLSLSLPAGQKEITLQNNQLALP